MKKKQLAVVAAVLIVLLVYLFWDSGPDPDVARVLEMQQALFGPSAQHLAAAERRGKLDALKKAQRELTPAQRKELSAALRQQKKAELERYFSMSQADKKRWLDEQINRTEALRQEWAKNGKAPPKGSTATTGNSSGAGTTSGGAKSFEEREHFRKQMLDVTTPEERAMRDQVRKDLAARRAQRGLPALTIGPR